MSFSKDITDARRYIESKNLYLMQKKDIDRFVECSVASYGNVTYPLNDYFMGRSCTNEDLRAMWLFNLRYFCNNALIYADSPECNAWTLWIEPGCKGVSVFQFLLNGGLRMMASLGIGSLKRIMAYEDYSKEVRINATGGHEWYLYNLVVRPEAQGQHLVGKLLSPMLEYCEQSGRPVYLETHSEKNVGMYRHFGFEVASDGTIPSTDVTHWGIWKL